MPASCRGTSGDLPEEIGGTKKSVMPLDVLGRTRTVHEIPQEMGLTGGLSIGLNRVHWLRAVVGGLIQYIHNHSTLLPNVPQKKNIAWIDKLYKKYIRVYVDLSPFSRQGFVVPYI